MSGAQIVSYAKLFFVFKYRMISTKFNIDIKVWKKNTPSRTMKKGGLVKSQTLIALPWEWVWLKPAHVRAHCKTSEIERNRGRRIEGADGMKPSAVGISFSQILWQIRYQRTQQSVTRDFETRFWSLRDRPIWRCPWCRRLSSTHPTSRERWQSVLLI